jgi:hypothetical protein
MVFVRFSTRRWSASVSRRNRHHRSADRPIGRAPRDPGVGGTDAPAAPRAAADLGIVAEAGRPAARVGGRARPRQGASGQASSLLVSRFSSLANAIASRCLIASVSAGSVGAGS